MNLKIFKSWYFYFCILIIGLLLVSIRILNNKNQLHIKSAIILEKELRQSSTYTVSLTYGIYQKLLLDSEQDSTINIEAIENILRSQKRINFYIDTLKNELISATDKIAYSDTLNRNLKSIKNKDI